MTETGLHPIANTIIRRAQRQGFVLPREVREELTRAGEPEGLWPDVLALARPALSYRQGRYYFVSPASARLREEQQQQRRIQQAVRRLIRRHRANNRQPERRRQDRLDFIQPVQVLTEDQRRFTLLSRDLSPTGIRLIGTRRLLGQKVRVTIPCPPVAPSEGNGDERTAGTLSFLVRVLWTCAIGEDLFENGGTFLEALEDEAEPAPQ